MPPRLDPDQAAPAAMKTHATLGADLQKCGFEPDLHPAEDARAV
jgi:hypothetical protein